MISLNQMKNQILFVLGGILLVVLGVLAFNYATRPEMAVVDGEGKISGNYALESIQRVGTPLVCTFEKNDDTSRISGVIHTDNHNTYGEFRISTDLVADEFGSSLLVKNKEAFVWTTSQNVGYQTAPAKNATKNASPEEQAQIIGARDKMDYRCEPWQNPDQTIFEVPSWINFVNL